MLLPNRREAFVSYEKIALHLLSDGHPFGRHKAVFFRTFGFSGASWQTLAQALREHAQLEVTNVEETAFGTRYTIEGPLAAPDGRTPLVRTVWFLRPGEENPRFVTAYPLRRSAG